MPMGLTRKQEEDRVLEYIRENGRFSIFWALDTPQRANAFARLKESGRIVTTPGQFPWTQATIVEGESDAVTQAE